MDDLYIPDQEEYKNNNQQNNQLNSNSNTETADKTKSQDENNGFEKTQSQNDNDYSDLLIGGVKTVECTNNNLIQNEDINMEKYNRYYSEFNDFIKKFYKSNIQAKYDKRQERIRKKRRKE